MKDDARRDSLRSGGLAAAGLMDDDRAEAGADLLARAEAGGIETVRVLFPDQHGLLRGKTLTLAALGSALADGVNFPSSILLKDTAHRTLFDVWSGAGEAAFAPFRGASDALIVPDPASYRPLPWSPHSAWLLGDAAHRDGSAIAFAPRTVLRRAEAALAEQGLAALMGLEVEFHVFRRTDPRLAHGDATMPGQPVATEHLNQGWQYLSETRYAAAEEVLDLIRRNAEGLGLPVRSVEVEMGPSQFEVTFAPAPPLEQADNMVMFRTLVKEVCDRHGLHGTFMAKPRLANVAASGWHIHQSLTGPAGRNLMIPADDGTLSPHASGWIAGLLDHAAECCLLTNPTVNGYKRFAPYQLAPNRVQWGNDNRGAMLRGLMRPGDPASRVENRVADTTANPYYAFAAQIFAGLSGLRRDLVAPPPSEEPYDGAAAPLPASLAEAIDAFEAGRLFAESLGADVVTYLATIKRAEWERYIGTVSEWEQSEYFNLY